MRNAQQELNLYINRLQAALDDLKARIGRMLDSEPDADGVRSMPWDASSLPGEVVSALLEGYRELDRDLRIESFGRDLRLVFYRNPAAPVPVIHG